VRQRQNLSTPLIAVALVVALAACGDDPTRPDGFLDTAEAEAVMRSAAALPSLPELLAIAADGTDPRASPVLLRVHEAWAYGSAMDGPGGAARRRSAAAEAAPILAERIPSSEWAPIQVRIEHWIDTADRMLRHLHIPAVESRLAAARDELHRAGTATTESARVYHLMLAMAELIETTPRFVARTMVHDAAVAIRHAESSPSGRPATRSLERARRLADWAVRAADEEDHLRAIQRAYYAIQLVEER
jgi:hypothetical protein